MGLLPNITLMHSLLAQNSDPIRKRHLNSLTEPNKKDPIRIVALSTTTDFIFLLFTEILRFGASPDYMRIDAPEQVAEVARRGAWDLIIGLWNSFEFAAAAAALVLRQSDFNLWSFTLMNYGRATMLVFIPKSDPATIREGERLVTALDRLFRGFHTEAATSARLRSNPLVDLAVESGQFYLANVVVAHELNDLLTVILGCGEVLLSRLTHSWSGARYAEEVLAAATRAKALAANLLESGQRYTSIAADAGYVIAGSRGVLRTLAGENLALTIRMSPDPTVVTMERHRLEKLIADIVVHARLAMPGGGLLELSVSRIDLPAEGPFLLSAPGQYASIAFGYKPKHSQTPGTETPSPVVLVSRRKASEIGLSSIYTLLMEAGGRLAVAQEASRIVALVVLLPLAGMRGPTKTSQPESQ
jgi:signal transduction histidine kinase